MSGVKIQNQVSNPTATENVTLAKLCMTEHSQITPSSRLELMLDLRSTIKDKASTLTKTQKQQLAELVKYICDWPLLIDLSKRGFVNPTCHEVVFPYIQLGDFKKGLSTLNNWIIELPADKKLLAQQTYLKSKLTEKDYKEVLVKTGKIHITPLEYHHVSDFIWQFADPAIAELCSMPKFESAEHWINWLYECKRDNHQHLYAIVHEEWGFIGSVCLLLHNKLGFFYYWLGKDFQGQGLGPRAVRILLDIGYKKLGMESCFTKIFDHNTSSHKAITKLDFDKLPFTAIAPSENEIFYYQGKETHSETLYQQLFWLLEKLNSGITLSPLQQ
ncbi:hypothetical protein D210916BOD24_11230 [Alteromonas sp. D210916BOD_24]|uniref:GNAT family N-acetyltransferase n=1 Tax=Alteromonas sp. D210916BOD_24 TaxID=3157618 RepID=UPI00399D17D0